MKNLGDVVRLKGYLKLHFQPVRAYQINFMVNMSDSEYSDIEEDEQIQGDTSVSLGFADERADVVTQYDNHLGGQPVSITISRH